MRDVDLEGCHLGCLRVAMNGAEPIAPSTMRAFAQRFAGWGLREDVLTPVYGLSEATLAVTMSDPSRPFRSLSLSYPSLAAGRAEEGPGVELVSVGRPLRGTRVEVWSDLGERLGEGRVGHIRVRGPSVMHGYADGSTAPLRDGWLDTGDLGFMREGELYVTGRARDVIIVRGANHPPQAIERAVDGVPGVRAGCAAAVGEITGEGEHLLLFVEVRRTGSDTEDACRQAVLSAVGVPPTQVAQLAPGTLPRTSSGKIRRGETLRRWRAGTLERPRTARVCSP